MKGPFAFFPHHGFVDRAGAREALGDSSNQIAYVSSRSTLNTTCVVAGMLVIAFTIAAVVALQEIGWNTPEGEPTLENTNYWAVAFWWVAVSLCVCSLGVCCMFGGCGGAVDGIVLVDRRTGQVAVQSRGIRRVVACPCHGPRQLPWLNAPGKRVSFTSPVLVYPMSDVFFGWAIVSKFSGSSYAALYVAPRAAVSSSIAAPQPALLAPVDPQSVPVSEGPVSEGPVLVGTGDGIGHMTHANGSLSKVHPHQSSTAHLAYSPSGQVMSSSLSTSPSSRSARSSSFGSPGSQSGVNRREEAGVPARSAALMVAMHNDVPGVPNPPGGVTPPMQIWEHTTPTPGQGAVPPSITSSHSTGQLGTPRSIAGSTSHTAALSGRLTPAGSASTPVLPTTLTSRKGKGKGKTSSTSSSNPSSPAGSPLGQRPTISVSPPAFAPSSSLTMAATPLGALSETDSSASSSASMFSPYSASGVSMGSVGFDPDPISPSALGHSSQPDAALNPTNTTTTTTATTTTTTTTTTTAVPNNQPIQAGSTSSTAPAPQTASLGIAAGSSPAAVAAPTTTTATTTATTQTTDSALGTSTLPSEVLENATDLQVQSAPAATSSIWAGPFQGDKLWCCGGVCADAGFMGHGLPPGAQVVFIDDSDEEMRVDFGRLTTALNAFMDLEDEATDPQSHLRLAIAALAEYTDGFGSPTRITDALSYLDSAESMATPGEMVDWANTAAQTRNSAMDLLHPALEAARERAERRLPDRAVAFAHALLNRNDIPHGIRLQAEQILADYEGLGGFHNLTDTYTRVVFARRLSSDSRN